MLKPSKRHFILYDAQTYEKTGLTQVNGNVRAMAQKPRFWSVTATAKTQNQKTGEIQKKHFNFKTPERFMLSELAPIVNQEIHKDEDYLPDCISVLVCARVMTEGGV